MAKDKAISGKQIKAETILLVLYTDKDGRRLVGGRDINSGREWIDVFNDCAATITETGHVVDVELVRGGEGK